MGEICLQGRSIARGKWNKPSQTAESFGARLLQDVCDLYRCSLDEAVRKVGEWEEHAVDPTSVLAELQQQAGERMLVDKSPINSKTPQGLRRAAQAFGDDARYVHLVRHPYAMIDSYASLGLQRLLRDALPGNLTPALQEWTESGKADASSHAVASGPEGDALLDEGIVRREGMLPGDETQILLTGATGFLGAYLLHALLQRPEAHITCLVRCDNEAQGLQRLAQNLAYYHLPTSLSSRVTVLPGDLSAPRLGLTGAQFAQLVMQIGVIYHNGATVDFLKPYALLRDANVIASRDLLRLSVTGTLKTMHYVSSVASTPVDSAVFSEQQSIGALHTVCGGYGQTKWVGERLMQAAASRGIPVAIYRPGRIMGDSVHGTWNKHALLAMMMSVCVRMKMAPDIATPTDMSPVD